MSWRNDCLTIFKIDRHEKSYLLIFWIMGGNISNKILYSTNLGKETNMQKLLNLHLLMPFLQFLSIHWDGKLLPALRGVYTYFGQQLQHFWNITLHIFCQCNRTNNFEYTKDWCTEEKGQILWSDTTASNTAAWILI